MFNRTVIVLLVSVLGISWTQALVIQMPPENYESMKPALLNNHNKYMDPRDNTETLPVEYPENYESTKPALLNNNNEHIDPSDIMATLPVESPENHESTKLALLNTSNEHMDPRDNTETLPVTYVDLLWTFYLYARSPKDQYAEVLLGSRDTDKKLDQQEALSTRLVIQSILETPKVKSELVLFIIQHTLERLTESCELLKKQLNKLISNPDSTPLRKESGLSSERELQIILLEVNLTEQSLQDLRNTVELYKDIMKTNSSDEICVKTLQELLRYTASIMASVRSLWNDLKLVMYNSHFA